MTTIGYMFTGGQLLSNFETGQSTTTLQDFKFQGTETRDGVVFANDHSIFFNQNYRWLCRSVTELWT